MPLQQVHLRINDAATGQPTPVRMRITDADGTKRLVVLVGSRKALAMAIQA